MPSSRKPSRRSTASPSSPANPTRLRIIGGDMRGRPLEYHGDPRTRPMKDRVREAVFNLLGPSVQGTTAIDLFAGTGALGLEALSRRASRAVCVERHFPSARLIERNAADLGVRDRVQVVAGDTFIWALQHEGLAQLAETGQPWIMFCSPPYALFVDRTDDMLRLLDEAARVAPTGSQFVVESDERFDIRQAMPNLAWDVRIYHPAVVAIAPCTPNDRQKPSGECN